MSKKKRHHNSVPNVDYEQPHYRQTDENIYLWIIRIGTYLTLLTPLIIKSRFLFPFVSVKTTLFRVLVEIIFAAYLILAFQFPKYRPHKSILSLTIGIFMGVIILTAFTGVNFHQSVWSTYERMTGVFTFLHLWAFFIVLTSVFRDRKEWKGILTASVIIAAFASIYAFMAPGFSRGGGTIGNSSFLAAYLLFNVFLAGMLFLKEGWWWRILYGPILIIITWKFLTTGARAAILSFFGGIFLLILFYGASFFYKKGKNYLLGFIIFLVIIGGATGFLLKDNIKQGIDDIVKIQTIQARSLVWKTALEGWKERFWLGWGPENFNLVFNKYFDPRIAYPEYGGEVWFDRTHNIIFDTAATSGAIGLISYFSIFGIALFALWRKYLLTQGNFWSTSFLSVILIAYFVQNLSVFDMINTYLMFFLVLAYIDFCTYAEKKEEGDLRKWAIRKRTAHPALIGFLIFCTLFIIVKANIQPLWTGRIIDEISSNPHKRTFGEMLDLYEEKVPKIWWGKLEIREAFSRFISGYVYNAGPGEMPDYLQRGLLLAVSEGKKNIEDNPMDFRRYLVLGDIYNVLSKIDSKYVPLGKQTLEEGIKLSPKNMLGYQQLGQNRIYAGDFDEAIAHYKYAVDLAPKLANSHWYLSQAYRAAGRPELGFESAQKAVELGYPSTDVDSLNHIADLYLQLGDAANAILIYQEGIKLYPKNVQLRINFAVVYKNIGDKENAAKEARIAAELDPNIAADSQKFIESLGD